MASRLAHLGWLIVAGMVCVSAGTATAQQPDRKPPVAPLPLDDVPTGLRGKIKNVLDQPLFSTRGPAETFACQPFQYTYLLDHPDQAVKLWRKLGAKCVTISDRGQGRFGWSDEKGGDLHWDTAYNGPKMRIWYAEGKVRPGALLPLVNVRAVVVLRHSEGKDAKGNPLVRHQAELFLTSDSATAALAARLLGPSAPRMAEQYVGQMQTFFSALAWYYGRHPEAWVE
jgi:hypothetical protein